VCLGLWYAVDVIHLYIQTDAKYCQEWLGDMICGLLEIVLRNGVASDGEISLGGRYIRVDTNLGDSSNLE
jgi:hypothetical protein